VVLDNFKTHRAKAIQEEMERKDIIPVYLPPYSPDLNPIEYIWKSIKRVISVRFIRSKEEMEEIIEEAFYRCSRRRSYTRK
jgi:putative transposase